MSEPLPPTQKKPLGVLRGLGAALGIIIMVLTGGCTLLYWVPSIGHGPEAGLIVPMVLSVLIFAGVPFLVGLGIFLAATRLGRR